MKNTDISIYVPVYNGEKTLERCINSVLEQSIKPSNILILNDCSNDNTYNIANDILSKSEKKHKIVKNKVNMKALYNLYTQIHDADDDTIIVTLDGDDAFAGVNVFNILNKHYQDPECWMTVGSYVQNDNYIVVSPRVSEDYWNQNIREIPWSFSHLRTF